MDSHEHPIDKAQWLQDERIKADWNFFVTWDQWVPLKLWPTPSPQKDMIPVGLNKFRIRPKRPTTSRTIQPKKHPSSVIQTQPDRADALSKNILAMKVIFDMGWSTEADDPLTMETPTGTSSASEHFGGQTFNMCWDTEVDLAPIMSEDAARPAAAGQYNLCWDDEPTH
ncbi:uncharacterized protein EDB91DRAFT_1253045 [Suillus paluster]|uniref:uncharacterized protein n=1 Tax=Suillus paluster TaxID=48578 RepID=UPI001B86775B|nr:uncharacterized protein EDB91DRAFT_1253045 [Suillus paluster]KAG1729538.1 hypothetical protein EDB91DRAFT_1253045 [Suillus paluster]